MCSINFSFDSFSRSDVIVIVAVTVAKKLHEMNKRNHVYLLLFLPLLLLVEVEGPWFNVTDVVAESELIVGAETVVTLNGISSRCWLSRSREITYGI